MTTDEFGETFDRHNANRTMRLQVKYYEGRVAYWQKSIERWRMLLNIYTGVSILGAVVLGVAFVSTVWGAVIGMAGPVLLLVWVCFLCASSIRNNIVLMQEYEQRLALARVWHMENIESWESLDMLQSATGRKLPWDDLDIMFKGSYTNWWPRLAQK
jgi:hypothetical protein